MFSAAAGGASAPERVLVLGDSLTEGYGVSHEQAFPAVLQDLLNKKGQAVVEVIDAGVSGATSASGVSSLNWQLKREIPNVLILELGANDGLRGLDPEAMKKNLRETIQLAKSHGSKVLLAGMKAPPNYGKAYVREFDAVFPALAREERIALMPFLLAGVAGDPSLNQEDGIHPNEQGARIIALNLLKYLEPLL